jgi:hypothetical protein
MSEKTAAVDQMKGATLEEISAFVEQIGREFKTKQLQLQPLMTELKVRPPLTSSASFVCVCNNDVCVMCCNVI